jgi:tryptophan-rich sensory protein
MTDKLIIFIPLISGFVVGYFCGPEKNTGKSLPATPPPYIFGIVWTMLYLLIGYSWYITRRIKPIFITDLLFIINTFLSIKWLLLFGCLNLKKYSLYCMILLIASTIILILYSFKYSLLGACLLVPYLSWLLFAQQLNYTIVNNQ